MNPGIAAPPAIGLLLAALALAWVLAEWMRRRRLRRFGDPAVLGVRRRWSAAGLRFCLFAAALVAVAGAWTAEFAGAERDSERPLQISLLLDSEPPPDPGAAAGAGRRSLEQAAGRILEEFNGTKFSVFAGGHPADLAVPPTFDIQGALIILAALPLERRADGAGPLIEAARAIVERTRDDKIRMAILVVTSKTAAEIAREIPLSSISGSPIAVCRVTRDEDTPEVGVRGADGRWRWQRGTAGLSGMAARETAGGDAGESWYRRLLPWQYWAAVAFVILCLEHLHVLLVPLNMSASFRR